MSGWDTCESNKTSSTTDKVTRHRKVVTAYFEGLHEDELNALILRVYEVFLQVCKIIRCLSRGISRDFKD